MTNAARMICCQKLLDFYYLAKPTAIPTSFAGIACKYYITIGSSLFLLFSSVMKESLKPCIS